MEELAALIDRAQTRRDELVASLAAVDHELESQASLKQQATIRRGVGSWIFLVAVSFGSFVLLLALIEPPSGVINVAVLCAAISLNLIVTIDARRRSDELRELRRSAREHDRDSSAARQMLMMSERVIALSVSLQHIGESRVSGHPEVVIDLSDLGDHDPLRILEKEDPSFAGAERDRTR